MPDSYIIKDQHAIHFLTFQVVAWVDVFTRKQYKDIIVDAFNYCVQHKNLKVHGWCIMINHVHCILSSGDGRLSDTVRDFKRHTARQLLTAIDSNTESRRIWMQFQFQQAASQHVRNEYFQLWTHENHAELIDPHIQGMFQSKLRYIHYNPVKEGIVELPENYLYSSAVDYNGHKGMIQLEMLL
jgi:REP element-mobilizing transposase RayT